MGITIGERQCINCRDYMFHLTELEGRMRFIEDLETVGMPKRCKNCNAVMLFLLYHDTDGYGYLPGVAFSHTKNDEPCYDKDCSMCNIAVDESEWTQYAE